jgi:hypothetical protein
VKGFYMRKYNRLTLEDFSKPILAQDVAVSITSARGRIRLDDLRDTNLVMASIMHDDFAVPESVIAQSLAAGCDPDAVAARLTSWFASADLAERTEQICHALLCRTETAHSDAKWVSDFSRALARVFGVDPQAGVDAMQTPAQKGCKWTHLVAQAAAGSILAWALSPVFEGSKP